MGLPALKKAPIARVAAILLVAVVSAACSDTGTSSQPDPVAPLQTPPPPEAAAGTAPLGQSRLATSADEPLGGFPVGCDRCSESPGPFCSMCSGYSRIVISRLVFGEASRIELTNSGSGSGNLRGHFLGHDGVHVALPNVILAPGASAWIALEDAAGPTRASESPADVVDASGEFPPLSPARGEVALFRNDRLDRSDSLVSYVAWGRPGGTWSLLAVDAALWTPDGFVAIAPEAPTLRAVSDHPVAPTDWEPQQP